jgi:hypothetical protein
MTIPLGKKHLALVTMTQTLNTNGYSQTQLLKNVWMFLFHPLVLYSMIAHLYYHVNTLKKSIKNKNIVDVEKNYINFHTCF